MRLCTCSDHSLTQCGADPACLSLPHATADDEEQHWCACRHCEKVTDRMASARCAASPPLSDVRSPLPSARRINDRRLIALRYLRGMALIDIASAVPFEVIVVAATQGEKGNRLGVRARLWPHT